MATTVQWWNLPSATKQIMTIPQNIDSCSDNAFYKSLVQDITWFNLPYRIKIAVEELSKKTEDYNGLEDLPNIKFQWFDLVQAIKILKTEIEGITCKE
jgi:hypothetical protein